MLSEFRGDIEKVLGAAETFIAEVVLSARRRLSIGDKTNE